MECQTISAGIFHPLHRRLPIWGLARGLPAVGGAIEASGWFGGIRLGAMAGDAGFDGSLVPPASSTNIPRFAQRLNNTVCLLTGNIVGSEVPHNPVKIF